jgi:hypothetical protein
MFLPAATSLLSTITRATSGAVGISRVVRPSPAVFAGIFLALLYRASGQDLYNILWAVVFGFATLNILSLAARRSEPGRRGISFGELMAVMIVLLSIFLLATEMLHVFRIFPIKLRR